MLTVKHKGMSRVLYFVIFMVLWVSGGKTIEYFFFQDLATASFPIILFCGFLLGTLSTLIAQILCIMLLDLEVE